MLQLHLTASYQRLARASVATTAQSSATCDLRPGLPPRHLRWGAWWKSIENNYLHASIKILQKFNKYQKMKDFFHICRISGVVREISSDTMPRFPQSRFWPETDRPQILSSVLSHSFVSWPEDWSAILDVRHLGKALVRSQPLILYSRFPQRGLAETDRPRPRESK